MYSEAQRSFFRRGFNALQIWCVLQTAVHGTFMQAGEEAMSFSFLVEGLNATVRVNATAPKKCDRPQGWCDAEGGKYYKERDCNMDGVVDRICDTHNSNFRGGEKRWILLSGSCGEYNTGDAPSCGELKPKEDARNRWDASAAAAWQDPSDHAKRGTVASQVVIEPGMHKIVKVKVSDCPGSAPIQVGISTAGWQPNSPFGKESTRSVWGTSALAILAYSGHESLAKEDAIHERKDKWNGPQTVTLDVDMSLNPRTIEWRSDKHAKDFSKAFFTWDKVSPSVHNALSTCKYTLLSVEDPSIVTWINAPKDRVPQGADDRFMKRASFKKEITDAEGGCLPFCAQDPDVLAAGVKSSKPEGEYCWCFTRYLSNTIYDKAVKKYDDANVVIAKWAYRETNYQAYTKILRNPVPGYLEPQKLDATSGCPEDGSSCENWFSGGCSSQKPASCTNDHTMSPFAAALPKDERADSRWYVQGCSKGKCQDVWMVFDLKDDFMILSKLNLLNYQDVYGVKKVTFLTSGSLSGPWRTVQVFDDIPAEGEGNAGITENYCCEIPNTNLIFENPVVGRYVRLKVEENHGGDGAGLFRAYFHGFKGCEDVKERGKSCKGAVHVQGSPGIKDVYTCWAAVREQCDGDSRFDFDATKGLCRCTHTNCKDTVQDSTSNVYEICEACPAIYARDKSCREKAHVSGSPGIRDAQACLDKVRKECPESRFFSFRASDDSCICGGEEETTCSEWDENAGFNVYAVCGASHGVPSKIEWKLVFRQTFPEVFEEDEWSKNERDPKADNFAVLDQLESFRIDGAFTFKLRWPNALKDQEWRQTSNPVTTEGKVENYEAIDVPYDANGWGGLRHGKGKSLLDGSANMDESYWYYAVGATTEWRGGFPGPESAVKQVELWVRAPTDEVCWAPLKSKGYLVTEVALERNVFRVNVECDTEKEYEGTARAVACEGGQDIRYKLKGCYAKGEERTEGCDASCATCTGPAKNQCASCSGKRFLAVTTCVFECPSGLFPIEDPENGNKCVDSTTTPAPKEEELDWIVKHNINWTIHQGQSCSVELAMGTDRAGTSSDACTRLCALDSKCYAVSTILRNTKITKCRLFSSCEDLQDEDDANTYAKVTTTTTTTPQRFKWIEIGPGKCTDSSGKSIKAALPSKAVTQKSTVTTTTTVVPDWEYLANSYGTDLFALLKGPKTSSGKTEISILSMSSYYQEEVAHYSTALPYTSGPWWQFGLKGNGDLVAIQTGPRTKSKRTEISVLTAASKYQRISLKAKTPVGYTRPINNRFLVNWRGDVLGVWRGPNTGSGKTEVHVLSASSRYQRWALHMATPLAYSNTDRWQYGLRGNGDLVMILHKEPTGTKMTEVHTLSATSHYRRWSLQTGTSHPYAPSGVQFAVANNGDLLAVHEGPGIGLGNGRPEAVYTLTLNSAYKEYAVTTPKYGALASSSCTVGGCDPPQTPDLAFDGNLKTFWNGCCQGYPNQWLEYKFDTPTRITGYGLTTSDGECPAAWVFEGSYDGESFTLLDQQQQRGCDNWVEQVHRLRRPSLQRIFRWRFSAGQGLGHGGKSNGFILRNVRFFTDEREQKGVKDCYEERTLVADEGPWAGDRFATHSIAACQEECSGLTGCESFAYCASSRNCHYKKKIVGAQDAATTHPGKLKDCKTFYKSECKDKDGEADDSKKPRACYKVRSLVADEGEQLGHLPGDNSVQKCEEQCSSILGCNSFAMCDKPSDCHFKKKIITEKDAAATHLNAKRCKSYYKVDCPEEKKECYKSRTLVADEGKHLGKSTVSSSEDCEKQCSRMDGCKSFAMCRNTCYFKDKLINITDKATTDKKKLPFCKSYFKTDCASQASGKIIKFDHSGCAVDKQFAYWKDKCYSFDACAKHCENSDGCFMFQTNGCHCIFYASVSAPYSAPSNWKCGVKSKAWQPICTPFASDATGDTGWAEACKDVPAGAAYLKLDMGEVVDYFRPRGGLSKPYCDMLTSYNKHEFSPDGETWYMPVHYHAHLGGSTHNWPATVLKDRGDKRKYLSFWGGHGGRRGCCHEAYDDTASWHREFSFHYCAPKCIDNLDGEDYCSKWCNHKGKWGCGVQSHGKYTCDCTCCSGCRATTTTTTQGVLLGFSGPYRIDSGGDVDGFKYFRSKTFSDNFLTDEKVGDSCDAWAVVGGVNGGTHAGGVTYYFTHLGWPTSVVHFEFHFCDFVTIKQLRVGTPHSGHDVLGGTLQYWHNRQWVTARAGHQINQRTWIPEWRYDGQAWEVLYRGTASSRRWRLANYMTKNNRYFSGIELSWVAKGREYEKLQTSCANAKQHLSGRILVDAVDQCEELCNARPGCDSFVHAEEGEQQVCYLKSGCRGLPGPCKNWCGYQLKGAEGSERKCLTFRNWRKASDGPQVQISLGHHIYGADVGSWQTCLLLCQLDPKCKQVVYKDGHCFGTSAKKDEDADKKGGKNEGYMSAHCFEEAKFSKYRLNVGQNAGSHIWCLQELKLYAADGGRLQTLPKGGTAQSTHPGDYGANKAFNEVSNNDEGWYCSAPHHPTGWLEYTFDKPVGLGSYRIERIHGQGNDFSPVSWTFAGSNDGRDWTILDTQAGHNYWTSGEEKTFTVDPDSARNVASSWTVFYRGRIAAPPGHFESSAEKGDPKGHFFKRLPMTTTEKTLLRVTVEGGPCGQRTTVQFPIGNKKLLDYLREGKQSMWVPVDSTKVQIIEGSVRGHCNGRIDHFWTGQGNNKGWILGCKKSCGRGAEFASGHHGGCGKGCNGAGDFPDLSQTEVTMSFGQEPAEFCGWSEFPSRAPVHADCRHVFEHPSKEFVGGCTTAECQTLNDCHAKCSDCNSCVAVSYYEDGAQGFRCHMIGPVLQRLELVEKIPDPTTWAIHVSSRSDNCKIAVQVEGKYETCLAIKIRFPEVNSGVFVLRTPDGDEFQTWCDMSTQGGGWTMLAASKQHQPGHMADLLRRGTYKSYTETGIGNPDLDSSGIFWAPLKVWAQLTEEYPKNRMVVLDSHFLTPQHSPGLINMGINAKDGYRIKGNAVNSQPLNHVAQVTPQKFTTFDNDQDTWGANCAKDHKGYLGGFWYARCWQTSMYHSNGQLYSWNADARIPVKYLRIFFREDSSLQTTTTTTLYATTTTTTTTTTLGYVVEDLGQCQEECEEGEDCAAVSYNERTKECHMFGDIEMGYGNYIDENDVTCYAKAPQGWFEYRVRPGKLWDERCSGGETKCDFKETENFKHVCQEWCSEENSTRFCSVDISGRKNPCCRRSTSCEELETAGREYRIFKHQDHYMGMQCEDGSKCLILSWKFNVLGQFPKDVAAESCRAGCDSTDCHAFTLRSNYDNPEDDSQLSCFLYKEYAPKNTRCSFDPLNRHDCAVRSDSGQIWVNMPVQREYNIIGSGQTFQRVVPEAEDMASVRVYGNATMSSTYSPETDAQKCSDRRSDTRCISRWTQGRGENNPWWQLDMGKKERIVKVRILSEPDSCRMQKYVNMTCTLKGGIVGVSSRPCIGDQCVGQQCGSLTEPGSDGYHEVSCGIAPDYPEGQYVYVQLPGNRNIHFWELIAYKVAMAVPAKGTPSTSSVYEGAIADYCSDDDETTRCSTAWNSGRGEQGPWYQVDLHSAESIEKIQFFAKPDGCEALEGYGGAHCNPFGAIFGVGLTPCKDGVCDGYICGNITEQFYKEDWFEVSCGGMAGRYVWVQLPGRRVLNFFELKPFKDITAVSIMGEPTMSSVFGNFFPRYCVDHKAETRCSTKWNGAHGEKNPWFQLDLGARKPIKRIQILKSDSCAAMRGLSGMHCNHAGAVLGVSDEPCEGTSCHGKPCGKPYKYSEQKWYGADCGGTVGRYVYVQLPGDRVLNFYEMLVFESKDPYAKYQDEVEIFPWNHLDEEALERKTFRNPWKLVFKQDARGGMKSNKYAWTFQVHNYDKVMHYVAPDKEKHFKYSILSEVGNYKMKSGKWKFRLEYMSSTGTALGIWEQETNPFDPKSPCADVEKESSDYDRKKLIKGFSKDCPECQIPDEWEDFVGLFRVCDAKKKGYCRGFSKCPYDVAAGGGASTKESESPTSFLKYGVGITGADAMRMHAEGMPFAFETKLSVWFEKYAEYWKSRGKARKDAEQLKSLMIAQQCNGTRLPCRGEGDKPCELAGGDCVNVFHGCDGSFKQCQVKEVNKRVSACKEGPPCYPACVGRLLDGDRCEDHEPLDCQGGYVIQWTGRSKDSAGSAIGKRCMINPTDPRKCTEKKDDLGCIAILTEDEEETYFK